MTRNNITLVGLAGIALLIAGCGGSSSSAGVAHLSAATSSGSTAAGGSSTSAESAGPTQQQMIAFSQCMRTHGVPEFPEPTEGHVLIKNGNPQSKGLDPASARFQAARKACAKLLPDGGAPSPGEQAKLQEAALKFSQCMRTHGVPSFPDPSFSDGGGTVQLKLGKPGGVDPRSPQFKAAQKACQAAVPKLPGAKGGPAEGAVAVGGGPKGE